MLCELKTSYLAYEKNSHRFCNVTSIYGFIKTSYIKLIFDNRLFVLVNKSQLLPGDSSTLGFSKQASYITKLKSKDIRFGINSLIDYIFRTWKSPFTISLILYMRD